MEIFCVYGPVKHIEMPIDRVHASFSKGFAYVEYDNSTEAEKAIKYMNGGIQLYTVILLCIDHERLRIIPRLPL